MSKIVHVSATLATGIYTVICVLAKSQLLRGHEVFVVGCTRKDDSVSTWREELPEGVTLIEMQMEREIDPRTDMKACLQLRAILRDLDPDCVHLHSSKAGAIGRVASLFLGSKVVYQPNGFSFLRRDISGLKSVAFGIVEFILSALPGRIVAVSESERKEAGRFVFLRRMDVVPNSIEVPDAIHRFRAERVSGVRLKVGTCGRVSPQKDPHFFAALTGRCKDVADFHWIGGGNYPSGNEELKGAGIWMTGVVSREEALKEIADLDVYVQTSAWEGLPIAVLEAMALGIPVVVRDAVGNRDLLQGIAPELIAFTPEEMAIKVRELCSNQDKRIELGHRLKDATRREYSAEAQCDAFDVLYGLDARVSRK